MFNWFKNKLDNLIPSDINKGFMSSNFVTIKVGDKITVPENMLCFVSFHDKIYAELEPGTHSLNKELLASLYSKQQKGNKPLKKLKLDLFVINLNSHTLELSYTDKIPVLKRNTKFIIDINASLNVENAKTFHNIVCAEFYNPFAVSTNEFVAYCIENFVKKCFLKIKLYSYEISSEIIEDIKQNLEKYLSKLGLYLSNFKINLTTKNKTINIKTEPKSIYGNTIIDNSLKENQAVQNKNLKNSINTVDQNENINYTHNEQPKSNANICPVCNAKIITGSIFCHRCGNTLK